MSEATFVFLGRFRPDSFAAFVAHRAARLDLAAEATAFGSARAEVTVSGDAALIDAFEMACSLGPIDCLVTDAFRSAGSP